ncbi:TPA: hypothetical protein U5D43_003974 [Yersinia enterocolitica]|nr:hypothetical protein [Yersinia enterocolitica]
MSFIDRYNELIVLRPKITKLNSSELNEINNDLISIEDEKFIDSYYPSICLILLFIVFSGVFFLLGKDLIVSKSNLILDYVNKKKYFFNKPTLINIWLFSISLACFLYMWVIPIIKCIRRVCFFLRKDIDGSIKEEIPMSEVVGNMIGVNIIYVFYCFDKIHHWPKNIFNWFILISLNILMLCSFVVLFEGNGILSKEVNLVIVYVILSLPLVCIFIAILFVFAISMMKLSTTKIEFNMLNSILICKLTSVFLDIVKLFSDRRFPVKKIINEINEVSEIISKLGGRGKVETEIDLFIRNRFDFLARYFDEIKVDLLISNETSSERIYDKLELAINAFINKNYGELTKGAVLSFRNVNDGEYKRNSSGIKSLILLTTLISSPVIVWLIFSTMYIPLIDEVTKSLVAILYTIWCALCVISLIHKLAPETKGFLMAVFQYIIPKGDK